MKLLKRIDIIIQAILIAGGIMYSFTYGREDGRFLYVYLIVGSWQLLSFFIHLTVDRNLFLRKERSAYGRILFWLLVIGITCLWGLMLVYLLVLMTISPFLALWYFSICLREVQVLNRKELVHLK